MHACVWSLYVLAMDTLGRGHFCIQALKGLMTNQENTSRFFFTIENEEEWWWNLTWTYILTIMCVYAAFDRHAVFIRWCIGWLSRLLYLNCLGLIVKNIDEFSLIDYCILCCNRLPEWWSYWKTPIVLSGVDYTTNSYAMSDVLLKAYLIKGEFRLIMTNDMCDLGSSRVLHHIQSCTLSLYFLHVIPWLPDFTGNTDGDSFKVSNTLWLVYLSIFFTCKSSSTLHHSQSSNRPEYTCMPMAQPLINQWTHQGDALQI